MKFQYLFCGLWLCLAWTPLHAQEKPTPPPGPLIQKVPAFADWTVTFKYPSDDKSGRDVTLQTAVARGSSTLVPKIRQERVTKTKEIASFSWLDEMGAKKECWIINGNQWVMPNGLTRWEIATSEGSPFFIPDLSLSAFTGFEWISPANYIGTKQFMGKECLAFQMTNPRRQAYIDSVTRLPVLLETDESVRTYTFATPPAQMLMIPEGIVQIIRELEEQTARIMAPGAR